MLVFVGDDSGTGAYHAGRRPASPTADRSGRTATPATSPVVAGGLLYVYDEIDGRLMVRAAR